VEVGGPDASLRVYVVGGGAAVDAVQGAAGRGGGARRGSGRGDR
jgi:hypothetical protein